MPDSLSSLDLLRRLFEMSWQATAIVLLVLVARMLFGRSIGNRWRHALWGLVLLRLVIPTLPASRFSIYRIAEPRTVVTVKPMQITAPQISAGQWVVTTEDPPIESLPAMAPVSTQKAAPQHVRNWADMVVCGWLLVAFAMIARLILINWRFNSSVKSMAIETDERFIRIAESARRRMWMVRTPAIVVTGAVDAPAVSGLVRPRILLPLDAAAIPDDRLRLVFLHELSHVKHHDILVDWVWAIVQSVHWFNPVLWIVWPLRRGDRELARDEAVLSLAGPDQAEPYGQTLLQLARPLGLPAMCPGLVGLFGRKNDLQRRVTMISRFEKRRPIAAVAGLVVLTVVGCGTLTSPKTDGAPATAPVASPVVAAGSESSRSSKVDAVGITTADETEEASPADKAIAEKLDQPVASVEFKNNSLPEVLQAVFQPINVKYYVDWSALQRANIARDASVSCRVKNGKRSKVLSLIFNSVAGDDDDHKLGYVIEEGVVTITTRHELNKNVVTRRYDINDLLFVPADYTKRPDLLATTEPAGNPPQSIFGTGQAVPTPGEDRAARIDMIKEFITQNVDTTSWKDNGGDVGSISSSPLRAILLITQTPEKQRKVKNVLEALRRGLDLQVSVETRFLTVTDAMIAGLPESLRRKLDPPATAVGKQYLTDDEVRTVLQAVAKTDTTGKLTAPRLTLFSGQRAVLVVVTQQSYVRSWSPVVKKTGDGSITSYEPVNAIANAIGISFAFRATVSADKSEVYMDLDPQVSRLMGLTKKPWPDAPAGVALSVEVPFELNSETKMSCSIPDRQTMLAECAGFSLDASGAFNSPAADPATAAELEKARHSRVFMLVKPTVLDVKAVKRDTTLPLLKPVPVSKT